MSYPWSFEYGAWSMKDLSISHYFSKVQPSRSSQEFLSPCHPRPLPYPKQLQRRGHPRKKESKRQRSFPCDFHSQVILLLLITPLSLSSADVLPLHEFDAFWLSCSLSRLSEVLGPAFIRHFNNFASQNTNLYRKHLESREERIPQKYHTDAQALLA